MTKTVLVNYVGGYCGNFLTGLIGEALGVNHTLRQRSDKNTYYYLSNDIHTKYTKIFGKLFDIRKGVLKKEDLKYIAENDMDEYYTHAMHLYNVLDDEDDEAFVGNLKSHYGDLIKSHGKEYFLTCIHYGFKYKDVTLHDVFEDATVIHIVTESKRYARLFHLLFHYKTRDDATDKLLQKDTLSRKRLIHEIIDPDFPVPFDKKSIIVDMGKLIFEKDYAHFNELELALSRALNAKVKLDKIKFYEYADRNVSILKSILGDDFLDQEEVEQIKKSLEYIDKEVRV